MKKILLFSAISLIITQSCDKIDDPIPAGAGTSVSAGNIEFIVDPSLGINSSDSLTAFIASKSWDSTSSVDNSSQRFIVLEEFTGHTCKECPDGAREIDRLSGVYGNQLIAVAIHASNFAVPLPSGNKFRTDFRVAGGHGETYVSDLNISAFPQGVVSRTTPNGRRIAQWETDILAIKDDVPLASLQIKNYYATTDTLVRIELEIEWKQTLSESYNIQVDLVENNIVDWQLDGAMQVSNYNHKHVLRKVVNDAFGKALKSAVAGEKETIQYITTFNSNWKVDDMEVVAFVFNSDPNSYEIIQGNSAHIK